MKPNKVWHVCSNMINHTKYYRIYRRVHNEKSAFPYDYEFKGGFFTEKKSAINYRNRLNDEILRGSVKNA